ncbi:MAG TPA: Do family serine endopeptidase [candidate division Zixibacteria bacterium]
MQKLGFKTWSSLLVASLIGVVLGSVAVMVLFAKVFPLNVSLDQKPSFYEGAKRINVLSTTEENITSTRENAIVRAAKRVGPAVVSISVVQTRIIRATPYSSPFGDPFFDEFWGQFFGSREYKQKIYGLGSGVIINPDGYILTNQHVVQDADEVKITLTNSEEYSGEVVGQDVTSDLALVKIKAKSLPYAALGNSDDLMIGEWAIALGNPFGYLLNDANPTVTVGVISALGRDIKRERGQLQVYRNMIQTDAAINPGNSGGPLVNADGEVIGINTFIFTTSRGSEGVGFAIPISRAKGIIADLIKYGEVKKAWIGIESQRTSSSSGQDVNREKNRGVVIAQVDKDSPAEKAGLKKGDIITQIGTQNINNQSDWDEIVSLAKAGETLNVAYLREGKEMKTDIICEPLPAVSVQRFDDNSGMTLASITPSLASQLGTDNQKGVVIVEVKHGSQADYLGLEPGDIIRQMENYTIDDLSKYKSIMKDLTNRKVALLVEREGEVYYVSVTR